MQVNQLKSFDFEGTSLRVFGDTINPLFAVSDVCTALGISNPTMAVSKLADFEKTQIDIGQGPAINAVNESGLYTLILRSRDAVKEGTPAYRFRVKVTAEILPAIRRTGRYECPLAPATLTEAHAYEIQAAVARRAKNVGAHYQTIYRALKARYQVTKYTHIRDADFEDAMRFIQTVDLRVPASPESPFDETGHCKLCGLQPLPKDCIVLTPLDINRLMNWIYCWRYLFREPLERFDQFLHAVGSPYSAQFHEMIVDSWMGFMESMLRKNGYEIRAMKCYQAFIGNK